MLKNPVLTRIRFRGSAIIGWGVIALLLELAASEPGAQGDPVGPDAVAEIKPETPGVWGCVSGTQAYSTGGGLCNLGDEYIPGNLPDPDQFPEAPRNHPMWTQNLYSLANNRFEQIGMSWVKHDDWGSQFNGSLCSPCPPEENCCVPTPEVGLGVLCKDTYTACLNGDQGQQGAAHGLLGPRYQINPWNGEWPVDGAPVVKCETEGQQDAAIRCRLQVKLDDLEVGIPYFLEQQVITPDETEATRNNNVSYIEATASACAASNCNLDPEHPNQCGSLQPCSGCNCLNTLTVSSGTMSCQEPAITAWKEADSSVVETEIDVPGEGRFILAAKATSIGSGWYSYEYALYNMNSETSAGSFRVPLPTGLSTGDLEDIQDSAGFHDINYHSGEIWDGTDWPVTVVPGSITWATTQTYTQNPNANALRWGTLYNFRFQVQRAPANPATVVTIGLFKTAPDCVEGVSVTPAGSPKACCLSNYSCVDTTACSCAQAGGTLSQATFCETTYRACCRPPPYEDCIVTTEPCSDAVGGSFNEFKLTCLTANCPSYNGPSFEP